MPNPSTPAKPGKQSSRARRPRVPQDNREQYEQQAEALITLLDFEYGSHDEGADIRERRKRPLCKGIRRHMRQLLDYADFLDPRTIRMFYVKLRLWGDMLEAEGAGKYGAMVEPQEKAVVELDKDTLSRLKRLAERPRYRHVGDVAAEIVRLYVPLLEDVESHMAEFRQGQFERELGRGK
jgi:hypothetical protein